MLWWLSHELNRRVAAAAVGAVALVVSAAPVSGQTQPNERFADPRYDFSRLDAALARGIDDNVVPGVSLVLLHRGRPVYASAWGQRDLVRREDFTLDTVARIYSSTKWLSGATVMRAVDEGLLSLDDEAGDWLPDYAELGIRGSSQTDSPTVREMFSHSSGMEPDSPPVYDTSITMAECADQLLPYVDPLLAAPGAQVYYGSNSMQISGRAVEVASGEAWQDFQFSRLLDPLEMDDTSFSPDADEVSRMGPVYIKFFGSWIPIISAPGANEFTENPGLAYGMFSTLDDYARFLLMFRNGGVYNGRRILSTNSVREIASNQVGDAPFVGLTQPPPFTAYGIGCWTSLMDANEVARFVSSAGFAGTFPWYDRQNDLAGVFFIQVILSEGTDVFTYEVVSEATRAVAGQFATIPELPLERTPPGG
ncbi:MAG: serine hydrolase domain-containing protein [Phycisphaerales bacterium]